MYEISLADNEIVELQSRFSLINMAKESKSTFSRHKYTLQLCSIVHAYIQIELLYMCST